jgi:hypothetical protein
MDDAIFSIKEKTFDKILNYAHYAKDKFKSEIGGMCVVLEDKDGDHELVDPVILKQTISGGNCVLDKDELAKYYTKADMKYNKQKYTFCWWHSHHTLGAFWSSTDTDTMEEASGSPISYSLVVSWDKEPYGHIFRVSYWKPIVDHHDIKLEITDRKEKRIPKSIIKEVDDKCSTFVATKSNYIGSPLNRNYRGYGYTNYGIQNELFGDHLDLTEKEDTTATYGIVLDEVDSLLNKLACGTINYHNYSYEIDKINDKLGKDHPISVSKEEEKTVDNILAKTASDYVTYDLSKEEVDDRVNIMNIEGDWA